MRFSTLGKLSVATLALSLSAVGCQVSGGASTGDSDRSVRASGSMGTSGTAGTAYERGGRVVDRSQGQTVSPDGTATRTRTQLRQTPSGTTVRETQTEQREVVSPDDAGATDPTRSDPGTR